MGGSFSDLGFEHKISKKDFVLVRKFDDSRLGEVSEMKNQITGKIVLMKEKEINTILKQEELLSQFSSRVSLNHRNLVSIFGFTATDGNDIFLSHQKICIYFEYLQKDLLQAIKNRKTPFADSHINYHGIETNPQPFEESELFGLMTQLIDVMEYLQQNGIHHGDIRPETCFISEEGIIKLFGQWDTSNESFIVDLIKNERNQRKFLTSTALLGLKKDVKKHIENRHKQDVFSLGLTMLECATLERSLDIYDFENLKLDAELLSERLMETKHKYSPRIFHLITKMLHFDEDKRPDFIELKQYLNEGKKCNESRFDSNVNEVHHFFLIFKG